MQATGPGFLKLALGLALASAALAYNPPDGPDGVTADPARPRGHGKIIDQAVEILAADGKVEAHALAQRWRQRLLDGVRAADEEHGIVEKLRIPGYTLDLTASHVMKSAFTHFYDPRTGEGLRVRFGHLRGFLGLSWGLNLDKLVDYLDGLSLGPWESWTLRGVHPGSDRFADLAYAQALAAMRAGDPGTAFERLGRSLHLLADATVPHHAADMGGQTMGSQHVEFENACDEYLDRDWHETQGGEYGDESPAARVDLLARAALRYLPAAQDPAGYEHAARAMMPLAERHSAGLIERFVRLGTREDFRVVRVKIREVRALSRPDGLNDPDFYVSLDLGGEKSSSSPIPGAKNPKPDAILPHYWEFVRRVGDGPTRVRLDLLDYDPGGKHRHDPIDLDPRWGDGGLDFAIDPVARRVTGELAGPMGAVLEVQGDAGSKHRAMIKIQVDAWP